MGEQETFFFGYHVVCLIDVLGQKQNLARWATLPEDGKHTPEFVGALKQTVGTVMAFRDQFISLFEEMGKATSLDKRGVLSREHEEHYQRIKDCMVLVERFSDTFVFSSQIPNSHGDVSITSLYRVLAACCHAMIVSLAAKIPVRGAVTVGPGSVLDDRSFYGPALAEAYHLENEIAGYPRVLVSPTVLRFLAEGQEYSSQKLVADIMRRLAELCRSFLCPDVDGCWIVDFLGEGIHNMLRASPGVNKAVKMGYDFVQARAKEYRQSGDNKLALRYYLLRKYMESRLPLWGYSVEKRHEQQAE
jgi:hypothetical protein